MRTFTHWILALFATPPGVFVLAALDSTVFFSLPFGIDAAVVILAARVHAFWWIVPMLATSGSLAGAALTFWMGAEIGDRGLERWIPERRLAGIRARAREKGAVALAVLDLIPPPFPFTPFVLAAGALEVAPRTFFVTLTVCRIFRFGLEAVLAVVYGRHILAWLDSELFHDVVMLFALIAIALTIFSLIQVVRATRSRKSRVTAPS
jgi:membrane protein YqaA with SNARE-associated domain